MADADGAAPAGRAAQAPTVRTIVGPTAAGKSAVAMRLAGRHAVVIISADSRQVYRRFDVGTAKPSAADRARVPHRGVDIAEPTERRSAFWWATGASQWIAEASRGGRAPLVVGGTGLYVRALFESSFEEPELAPERRASLQRFLGTLSVPELRRWCAALDPARSHLGPSQLLRAVEVALLSGERLSVLHVAHRRVPHHSARYLVVDPGRILGDRIAGRARSMLEGGWVEEVGELAATVPDDAPAWNSTGYRAVRSLVRGQITRSDVFDRVVIETRQYAKRQRTWFRHQLPQGLVTRVDPTAADWEERVERWWGEGAAE